MPEYYEIKIEAHLDQSSLKRFEGLHLPYLEGDMTLLSGSLPDQSALLGLLERLCDLNLTLISVTCGATWLVILDLWSGERHLGTHPGQYPPTQHPPIHQSAG